MHLCTTQVSIFKIEIVHWFVYFVCDFCSTSWRKLIILCSLFLQLICNALYFYFLVSIICLHILHCIKSKHYKIEINWCDHFMIVHLICYALYFNFLSEALTCIFLSIASNQQHIFPIIGNLSLMNYVLKFIEFNLIFYCCFKKIT